jgi:dephospho-CoA kinase
LDRPAKATSGSPGGGKLAGVGAVVTKRELRAFIVRTIARGVRYTGEVGAARVIGLTGGIASGKSTVARILRELGAKVIDADQLARDVVAPGRPALAEIVAAFGPEVLAPSGELDRAALGKRVFADRDARRRLEAITHPRIAQAAQAEAAAHLAAGHAPVFYEAALLVENGAHRTLPALWVVVAHEDLQLARMRARDGLDESAGRARLAAQAPLADKLAAATLVIDNNGDEAALRAQVTAAWQAARRALAEETTA